MEQPKQLNDTDPMPFGKYEGKLMQDVPVNYLHWFWENTTPWHSDGLLVMDYIRRNLDALKMENKDLIWSRK